MWLLCCVFKYCVLKVLSLTFSYLSLTFFLSFSLSLLLQLNLLYRLSSSCPMLYEDEDYYSQGTLTLTHRLLPLFSLVHHVLAVYHNGGCEKKKNPARPGQISSQIFRQIHLHLHSTPAPAQPLSTDIDQLYCVHVNIHLFSVSMYIDCEHNTIQ